MSTTKTEQKPLFGTEISTNFFDLLETKEKQEDEVVEETPADEDDDSFLADITNAQVIKPGKQEPKGEEEEIDEKPEEKDKPTPKKKVEEEPKDDTDWEKVAEVMVASGEWEPFEIEGEDKTIDEETFKQLKKEQDARRREKLYDGIPQEDKEWMEYVKNGGSFEAYAQTYRDRQQAENLDISTDIGKQTAIYAYYKNVVGWSDEDIADHIQTLTEQLKLDKEAERAKTKIEEITKKNHEQLLEKQAAEKTQREEAFKAYKNGLKTRLKEEGFQTKEVNTVVRDFTEMDERGLSSVDKKYIELKQDPEKIALLWSFLMDTENFLKKQTKEFANNVKLNEFKKIQFSKETKTKKDKEEEKEQKPKQKGLFQI